MDAKRYLRENSTSKININTGPRGAGKTLLMVLMIERALIISEWVNNWCLPFLGTRLFFKPLQVWSNLSVSIRYQASQDGARWPGADKVKILHTLPLDMHALITFKPDMAWGFAFIDELDQHADRQDWQNGGQKLLMRVFVQVRKLHLSLAATIQSINWVNPRLQFQVDSTVGCRDAHMSSWGRANDVEPGTIIWTYTKDLSGALTGETYEDTGKIYQGQYFGLPLHSHYETDFLQNPWEHYESISIARKKLILDPFGKTEEEEKVSYTNDEAVINKVLENLLDNKQLKLLRSELFKLMLQSGMVMNKTEAMSYMEDVYNVRKYTSMGNYWVDLSQVRNIKPQPPLDIPDDDLPPPPEKLEEDESEESVETETTI